MRIRAFISAAAMGAALCAIGTTTVGCGDSKPAAKTANVKVGTMPSEASWDGVYYSPLFGHLHMVADGDRVKGKWVRPRKGEWGTLEGKLEGNVLRFEWSEFIDGLVGPNSKRQGRGYFVYSRPAGENVDDKIVGEIGRGEDEVGTPWDAIKQRNVEPDLASIGGAGAGDVGGGDWDSPNTEPDEPEAPKEPDEGEPEPPEL